ncbi:hypothetical protein SB717_39140, partial [Priestia sp. SIMBA_032]
VHEALRDRSRPDRGDRCDAAWRKRVLAGRRRCDIQHGPRHSCRVSGPSSPSPFARRRRSERMARTIPRDRGALATPP